MAYQDRPTIMLVVHNGYAARYLLRTDVLPRVARSGVDVVILAPNVMEEYFRAEFEASNIFLEPYHLEQCRAYRDRSRLQRLFAIIRHSTLSARGDLSTLDYNLAVVREESGRAGVLSRTLLAAARAIIWAARRSRSARRALVALESALFSPDFHRATFEKYRPDVVVTTSLGYFDFDQYVMREARRHGARVVTTVLSWDNPTSWGLGGAEADHVVAWTEPMRRELGVYHDIPPERIAVCGVPHFDAYSRPLQMSREQLFSMWGLDPGQRLILFGSRAPTRYGWNDALIEMLARAIEEGRLPADCEVLVRLHPIHFRERGGKLIHQAVLDGYKKLADRYPCLHFDAPLILSHRLPLDMPRDDMDKLAALLRHSSVLVTMLSTLNIEAALFDLPVVNVCFGEYGRQGAESLREHEPSIGRTFTHIKRLIDYGASIEVFNYSELVDAVNRYLLHPEYERAARARVAEIEGGPNRGAAGEAVGEAVLTFLGLPHEAAERERLAPAGVRGTA